MLFGHVRFYASRDGAPVAPAPSLFSDAKRGLLLRVEDAVAGQLLDLPPAAQNAARNLVRWDALLNQRVPTVDEAMGVVYDGITCRTDGLSPILTTLRTLKYCFDSTCAHAMNVPSMTDETKRRPITLVIAAYCCGLRKLLNGERRSASTSRQGRAPSKIQYRVDFVQVTHVGEYDASRFDRTPPADGLVVGSTRNAKLCFNLSAAHAEWLLETHPELQPHAASFPSVANYVRFGVNHEKALRGDTRSRTGVTPYTVTAKHTSAFVDITGMRLQQRGLSSDDLKTFDSLAGEAVEYRCRQCSNVVVGAPGRVCACATPAVAASYLQAAIRAAGGGLEVNETDDLETLHRRLVFYDPADPVFPSHRAPVLTSLLSDFTQRTRGWTPTMLQQRSCVSFGCLRTLKRCQLDPRELARFLNRPDVTMRIPAFSGIPETPACTLRTEAGTDQRSIQNIRENIRETAPEPPQPKRQRIRGTWDDTVEAEPMELEARAWAPCMDDRGVVRASCTRCGVAFAWQSTGRDLGHSGCLEGFVGRCGGACCANCALGELVRAVDGNMRTPVDAFARASEHNVARVRCGCADLDCYLSSDALAHALGQAHVADALEELPRTPRGVLSLPGAERVYSLLAWVRREETLALAKCHPECGVVVCTNPECHARYAYEFPGVPAIPVDGVRVCCLGGRPSTAVCHACQTIVAIS